MNVFHWAEQILFSGDLEDKIFFPESVSFKSVKNKAQVPASPRRTTDIAFSKKRIKFPKVSQLHDKQQRIMALHSFANHELMAIEIFAAFFLLFPIERDEFLSYRGHLVQTLKEEQIHFTLYKEHIESLGGKFGDYPVNDFFWKLIQGVHTPDEFFAVVSLSLEAANLDFSKYYSQVFEEIEDFNAAKIMNRIYVDEIKHVSLGRRYIENTIDNENHLWERYQELLPENFSPARAKGIIFDMAGRKKAGLSDHFIESVKNYRSDFSVVNRKQWKI